MTATAFSADTVLDASRTKAYPWDLADIVTPAATVERVNADYDLGVAVTAADGQLTACIEAVRAAGYAVTEVSGATFIAKGRFDS